MQPVLPKMLPKNKFNIFVYMGMIDIHNYPCTDQSDTVNMGHHETV